MSFNSWVDLEARCPISIERIKKYYDDFQSNLPSTINLKNINYSKERVLEARSSIDSMITTLIQILYDREILKSSTDKILYGWLLDNLGRYIKRLDEKEDFYVIKFDEPNQNSRVGVGRLSAYCKMLRITSDTLIYESLLKSTQEYDAIVETKDIKKDKRTFLYILFQVIQVTLAIMGGLTREEQGGFKKGIVNTIPTTWQSLMTPTGSEVIRNGFEKETGQKLPDDLKKDLEALSSKKEDEEEELDEEIEEKDEEEDEEK